MWKINDFFKLFWFKWLSVWVGGLFVLVDGQIWDIIREAEAL